MTLASAIEPTETVSCAVRVRCMEGHPEVWCYQPRAVRKRARRRGAPWWCVVTYPSLNGAPGADRRDRGHFMSVASRVMRNLLADHARARLAAKRGAGVGTLTLEEESAWLPDTQLDAVAALDEALHRLEALDPRLCRVVEQRYFGGLSLEETADVLGVSLATVKRELRSAQALLAAELADDPLA